MQSGDERERLRHHLIHVVVLVSGQTAHKVHAGRLLRQRLVFLIESGAFRLGNGVVRIPLGARILVDDARLLVSLARELLDTLTHEGISSGEIPSDDMSELRTVFTMVIFRDDFDKQLWLESSQTLNSVG